jgi:glycosyltransferase involved in cell wall biosynthesis
MAGKVKLSVIIVTHNQSNILCFQIVALENQAGILPSELEVIVTDDLSEVSEVKQIEAILSQAVLCSRFLQQRGDRFWAARARNRAIACARGDVLLFLDGDMIPEVDVAAKHVALHASLEKRISPAIACEKTSHYRRWQSYPQPTTCCHACANTRYRILSWRKSSTMRHIGVAHFSDPATTGVSSSVVI